MDERQQYAGTVLAGPRGMQTFHYVASAAIGTLLAADPFEMLVLWRMLCAAFPELLSLCVMPDHVHLQLPYEAADRFYRVLRAFARWQRNHRRVRGRLFEPVPDPVIREGWTKMRADQRYIHLNPCRAQLVEDPLAWAASTHRDAVGLSLWPVRRPDRDPEGYHRFVSSDPSVDPRGTILPVRPQITPGPAAVLAAVSALGRITQRELQLRSRERTLYVRAARVLTTASSTDIGALVGLGPRAVQDVPRTPDAQIDRIARVIGDPRFPLITDAPVIAWEQWRLVRSEHR
jgi:hypothetical protein